MVIYEKNYILGKIVNIISDSENKTRLTMYAVVAVLKRYRPADVV